MAIKSVHLLKKDRDGNFDENGGRQYRSVYLVQTSDPHVSHHAVMTATGIPQRGTLHPEDSGAKVKTIDAEVDNDDGLKWLVSVTWQSPTLEIETSPLLEPPEISYGFAQFSRVADKDIDGNPIVNSAGEAFDPPLEQDDSRAVVLIKRNEASFYFARAIAYQDAVNTDAYSGAEPGTLKIARITADRKVHSVFGVYYEVTYEIHYRPDGWKRKVLDQGTTLLEGGVKIVAKDPKTLEPYQKPILLDGNGGRLEDGGEPVFLEFQTYREVPYGPLALPTV